MPRDCVILALKNVTYQKMNILNEKIPKESKYLAKKNRKII